MQLKGYLSDNKITVRQFSVMSDIPEDTLHKYIYKVRIPNKQNMKIIYQKTNGEVTPNDFYEVGIS